MSRKKQKIEDLEQTLDYYLQQIKSLESQRDELVASLDFATLKKNWNVVVDYFTRVVEFV